MNGVIITLALLIVSSVEAQQFQGIATYKTDRKVELDVDSSLTSEMQAEVQAMLRKQFQKEFSLQFNSAESLYEEVESLEAPVPIAKGGLNIMVSGGDDRIYHNLSSSQMIQQTEIMGKPFLIADRLEKPAWELSKETKNIGQYTCFKATFSRPVTNQIFDSESDSLVEVIDDRLVTAWYTIDIPVAHGPSEYWGLPGLILEVSDGNSTILCSKVVLNPEKSITIEVPKKGKKVSQAEFDQIQEEKTQEMMERFQSSNRRDDNNKVKIRIGG
jgi:GLPGLI family protein